MELWVGRLAALNACLNAAAAFCLLMGWRTIRRARHSPAARRTHKRWMLAALALSVAFLASYLTRYALSGDTPFSGPSWLAPIYYTILITHVPLAMLTVPLVLLTASRAFAERFDKHRRLARITAPIWMYVSVTGVLVYLLLYQVK